MNPVSCNFMQKLWILERNINFSPDKALTSNINSYTLNFVKLNYYYEYQVILLLINKTRETNDGHAQSLTVFYYSNS